MAARSASKPRESCADLPKLATAGGQSVQCAISASHR